MGAPANMLHELAALGLCVVRDNGGEAAHHPGVALLVGLHKGRVVIIILIDVHLVRRPEEQRPEEVDHEGEALQERHACKDEYCAEDDRTQDAPLQDRALHDRPDPEAPEDHGNDNEVVDAQALFNEVASEEDETDTAALRYPQEAGKGHTQAEPCRARDDSPPDVVPLRSLSRPPKQVQCQRDSNGDAEGHPESRACSGLCRSRQPGAGSHIKATLRHGAYSMLAATPLHLP
mmetsp:Transcript_84056/g.259983  ORF Transcript_84056/g.259983 Transcript_84056/m.259983 type:complete len:233 (+) Transcript_84056:570-1268(+)